MKKVLLAILIAALLIGVVIYSIKAAIALAAIIAIFLFLPKSLGYFLSQADKWEVRERAKRIKKIRELEREKKENIERIIREVPQEHFSR